MVFRPVLAKNSNDSGLTRSTVDTSVKLPLDHLSYLDTRIPSNVTELISAPGKPRVHQGILGAVASSKAPMSSVTNADGKPVKRRRRWLLWLLLVFAIPLGLYAYRAVKEEIAQRRLDRAMAEAEAS